MYENDKFKLTPTPTPSSDETNGYILAFKKDPLTLGELIEAVRQDVGKLGTVQVKAGGKRYTLRYEHGHLISSDIPEALLDTPLTGGTASGGWNLMDFEVTTA